MAGTFDVPSPAILKDVGQREMASLATLLGTVEPGQSVHGARRRIKQLRSLLRLLRGPLGDDAWKEANAALRDAAGALAGQRRAEALLAAAGKLEPALEAGGYWHTVAETHRAAHVAEGDPVAELASARQAITRAAAVLSATPLDGSAEQAASAAFLAAYRKARRNLRTGLAGGDPRRLHEARKYVIHHLHQLTLLRPEREQRLAALEALREVLGDLNDLDELQQLAAGIEIPQQDARRMRKARKRLLRRAEAAADRLFRLRPAAFGKRMGHAASLRSPRSEVALQGGE